MENLIDFFIRINESLKLLNIDLIVVLLVICGGFFQSRYLTAIKLNAALKTLIVSTILTLLYLPLTCDFSSFNAAKPCLLTALVSYSVATSFYELIVKHTMTFIKLKFKR